MKVTLETETEIQALERQEPMFVSTGDRITDLALGISVKSEQSENVGPELGFLFILLRKATGKIF